MKKNEPTEEQVRVRIEPRVEVDWDAEELLVFVHLESVEEPHESLGTQIVPFPRELSEKAGLMTGLEIDWENRTVSDAATKNLFAMEINEDDLFEAYEEPAAVDCD